ncbi:hypothetical protein ACFWOJ_37315 [Streptomyces sp. NPDC058439]|uniref:hypothetical protein n=1 Tax=Streptomyces sp. NPDC058439 TaxID=3346500 RepID=UPI0036563299
MSRRDAAYQAYCWARFASHPNQAEHDRAEARRVSNTDPESATEWQRWVVKVPLDTGPKEAIALAEMWARVAAVQEEGQ